MKEGFQCNRMLQFRAFWGSFGVTVLPTWNRGRGGEVLGSVEGRCLVTTEPQEMGSLAEHTEAQRLFSSHRRTQTDTDA